MDEKITGVVQKCIEKWLKVTPPSPKLPDCMGFISKYLEHTTVKIPQTVQKDHIMQNKTFMQNSQLGFPLKYLDFSGENELNNHMN